MAKNRQNRFQSEHNANNAFVKSQQMQTASMSGRAPNLKGEAMNFNSYMCNDGEHAQDLAGKATAGLDKKAFPVK